MIMTETQHDEDYTRDVAYLTWEGRKHLGIPEALSDGYMPEAGSEPAIAIEKALGFKPDFESKKPGVVYPWSAISRPYIEALFLYRETVDCSARIERNGTDEEKLQTTLDTARASNHLVEATRACVAATKLLLHHIETCGLTFRQPSPRGDDDSFEF